MITWGSIILLVLRTVGALIAYAHTRQLLRADDYEQIATSLSEKSEELRKANAARDAVHADLIQHPERLRDDDGFARKPKAG